MNLRMENLAFQGTKGVSDNAAYAFRPAFLDTRTGTVELARLSDGSTAAVHVMSWLPRDWATKLDQDGRVASLNHRIVAGFERDGIFYTRDQVADMD